MAQWAKVLAAKTDTLNSVSESLTVKRTPASCSLMPHNAGTHVSWAHTRE